MKTKKVMVGLYQNVRWSTEVVLAGERDYDDYVRVSDLKEVEFQLTDEFIGDKKEQALRAAQKRFEAAKKELDFLLEDK